MHPDSSSAMAARARTVANISFATVSRETASAYASSRFDESLRSSRNFKILVAFGIMTSSFSIHSGIRTYVRVMASRVPEIRTRDEGVS